MKCCRNCGQVLNGNEKYCPNCGNFVRKKGKMKYVLAVLIILIAVCLLGICLIIGLRGRKTSEKVTDIQEETTVSANVEYTKIFTDRKIEDSSDLEVMSGREYREYAVVDEEDVIRKMEFCYTNDIILYIVETAYFPIEGYTENELDFFDDEIKNETKDLRKLSFVEIEREVRDEYYVLKISYKYLDNPSYVSALYPLSKINGQCWGDDSGYVLEGLTKARLKNAGYVKK